MRHLALLRAVNVAGHGTVTMEALRGLFVSLGYADARTLLNTGNVVFSGRAPSEARLEKELGARHGLATEFFLRTAAEWSAAVAANPFREEAERDPGHLILLALKEAPAAGAEDALRAAIAGRERVHVAGRHAYAYYPDGVGRSKLTARVIERALGTRATGRNWNTARKLALLLEA